MQHRAGPPSPAFALQCYGVASAGPAFLLYLAALRQVYFVDVCDIAFPVR